LLLDRHTERQVLDRLLDDVRAGESRALVVRGDASIGKTALLEYEVDRAAAAQVVRPRASPTDTPQACRC
jgi:predicted ATPase